MNIFASDILFYIFGALAVILSLMVVFMRNPVSSAMMMALSFGATAAIMIGLGAHFLGILQILVYAGAIMVLFAFIIMLLNVKLETSPFRRPVSVAVGVIIAGLFLGQLIGIIYSLPGAKDLSMETLAEFFQHGYVYYGGSPHRHSHELLAADRSCGLLPPLYGR